MLRKRIFTVLYTYPSFIISVKSVMSSRDRSIPRVSNGKLPLTVDLSSIFFDFILTILSPVEVLLFADKDQNQEL